MRNAQKHREGISSLREKINHHIHSLVERMGPPSVLRDACAHALLTRGKRFRPALVLSIAQSLGTSNAMPAALAIESFHTASLIADDLPCMDNDIVRRNEPSLHVEFGEATALLASYALISLGYELLAENGRYHDDPARSLAAVEITSQNTGLKGAAGGQYDDIFPGTLSREKILEIMFKKTVSLFEIAFVYGWVFGGGAMDKLSLVRKTAHHYGLAFQIADDRGDIAQDDKNGHEVNLYSFLGTESADEMFHVELNRCRSCMSELGLDLDDFWRKL